jgi:hypothetical protein
VAFSGFRAASIWTIELPPLWQTGLPPSFRQELTGYFLGGSGKAGDGEKFFLLGKEAQGCFYLLL